jgi:hypothetical protein
MAPHEHTLADGPDGTRLAAIGEFRDAALAPPAPWHGSRGPPTAGYCNAKKQHERRVTEEVSVDQTRRKRA